MSDNTDYSIFTGDTPTDPVYSDANTIETYTNTDSSGNATNLGDYSGLPAGYTQQTDGNGVTTVYDADGNPYKVIAADGTVIDGPGVTPTGTNTSGTGGTNTSGNTVTNFLNDLLGTKLTDKQIAALGVSAGGLAGLLGANNPTKSPSGYQGGIPKYTATRAAVPTAPTGIAAAPHEYGAPAQGRRYFSDTTYTPSSNAAGVAAAQAAADKQAQDIAAAQQPVKAATGGIMAAKGTYLRGNTDGMADKLHTTIGGHQPAALSHGEFVIPADVVSHLGNGNSDAGAKKLYSMMDKIRMARTGTKKQGKQINPDKFMPGGSVANHAEGGTVGIKGFAGGGDTTLPAGTTGTESNLSNWAGPYVTDMLGKAQGLAEQPYQAYTGQLTAGSSPLQTQAFNAAGNLTTPSGIGAAANMAGNLATQAQGLTYNPTTTDFTTDAANKYMSPYLSASLDPQLKELQRQNQIANMNTNSKLTQAGAFGGSRQAVMNAENQRDMLDKTNQLVSQGYNTAYNNAQQQFNADQNRQMQQSQFGANYGLQGINAALGATNAQGQLGALQNQTDLSNLNAQAGLGSQQRGIESDSLAAQQAQFAKEQADPYTKLQFQQSMLQGLPLAAQNYNTATPSALQSLLGGTSGIAGLLQTLGYNMNIPNANPTSTTKTPASSAV